MKRLICLLLILCLAVSLCACGSSSNNLSFFLKEPPMEAVEKKFGNNYSDYSPRKDYITAPLRCQLRDSCNRVCLNAIPEDTEKCMSSRLFFKPEIFQKKLKPC